MNSTEKIFGDLHLRQVDLDANTIAPRTRRARIHIEIPLPQGRTARISRNLVRLLAATQAKALDNPEDRHLISTADFHELALLSLHVTRMVRVTRDEKGFVYRRDPKRRRLRAFRDALNTLLDARVCEIKAGRERQFRIRLSS